MTEHSMESPPDARHRKKKGAPSNLEIRIAEEVRQAAEDLARAADYAETYVARVALKKAINRWHDWNLAGRPSR